ncbi:MAG: methylated-DNA--[protein]-cysteine S-methyltransferase [Chitinophagaceae bacterium]|nr:MAG: methylated-DNA--[protein]-cysteine S-methyltransferase [Chitinophagaceae bacterium]
MSTAYELQIASLYLDSPLGAVRISGTSDAISEVHFLDKDEVADDRKVGVPAFDLIVECRRQLVEYFRGNLQSFDISINQQGTIFQQKVWKQLSVIRYGNTISYLSLAKQLGDQKVIRAAAAANGRNNIAIIVPCHRVIGSSGDLVGYAGGIWRKRWLLEHEQKFAHGVRTLF